MTCRCWIGFQCEGVLVGNRPTYNAINGIYWNNPTKAFFLLFTSFLQFIKLTSQTCQTNEPNYLPLPLPSSFSILMSHIFWSSITHFILIVLHFELKKVKYDTFSYHPCTCTYVWSNRTSVPPPPSPRLWIFIFGGGPFRGRCSLNSGHDIASWPHQGSGTSIVTHQK